jgi:integrase
MSEVHPTALAKPSKPYPDFPLFPHATKRWAKKIRGKLHYFGPWDDPDGALKKYLEQKDALHAGRTLQPDPAALTVKDACNAFLNAKQALVDNGELSPRTWDGYKGACIFLVKQLGKARLLGDLGPDDFAMLRNRLAKRYGPHGLGTAIQCIRCVCKYAFDAGLLERPLRYGPGFKRPSKKTLRLHRAKQGPKLFSPEEIRKLLNAASTQIRAMILLGINCGFGNTDCGNLPLSALDLEHGWVNYPRPKTGIDRRCPLWPETISAIKEVLANRPKPKQAEHAGLLFITRYRLPWSKDKSSGPVSQEMRKLLNRLGINGHRNFYTLRHTFRTVGDETKDSVACDAIMGHETPHMSSVYRERIGDDRLKAVADHVRKWLFAEPSAQSSPSAGGDPTV